MNALLCRAHKPATLLRSSLLLTGVLVAVFTAVGQTGQNQTAQHLDAIHNAEQQHRSPAEVGALWAHLASQYNSAADFPKAEDAYNRSLHLLKDVPESMPLYATTLDNLASLYLFHGKVEEAESVRKQALAIRLKLGNQADIGVSEVHVADVAFARRQYKKAEQLALLGMKDMSASTSPPKIGMLSALITVAYARCLRGRYRDGLASAQQASAFASAEFEPHTLAIGFALQTLGYAQWRNGDAAAGGKTMERGLEILRTNLLASDLRLAGALMQYEEYLVNTNRRPEADEVREEMARMNIGAGTACPSCTVSVYSLAKGLR